MRIEGYGAEYTEESHKGDRRHDRKPFLLQLLQGEFVYADSTYVNEDQLYDQKRQCSEQVIQGRNKDQYWIEMIAQQVLWYFLEHFAGVEMQVRVVVYGVCIQAKIERIRAEIVMVNESNEGINKQEYKVDDDKSPVVFHAAAYVGNKAHYSSDAVRNPEPALQSAKNKRTGQIQIRYLRRKKYSYGK